MLQITKNRKKPQKLFLREKTNFNLKFLLHSHKLSAKPYKLHNEHLKIVLCIETWGAMRLISQNLLYTSLESKIRICSKFHNK